MEEYGLIAITRYYHVHSRVLLSVFSCIINIGMQLQPKCTTALQRRSAQLPQNITQSKDAGYLYIISKVYFFGFAEE